MSTLTMDAFLQSIHDGKLFSYTCYKRGTKEIRTYTGRVDVSKHVKGIGLNYDPLQKNLLVVYLPELEGQEYPYRQANLDAPISLRLHGTEWIWDQEHQHFVEKNSD